MRTVLITMGDPLGIGPEIICKALLAVENDNITRYNIVGIRSAFDCIPEFKQISEFDHVTFIEVPDCPKVPAEENSGSITIKTLETVVKIIKEDNTASLVTAPISKERIRRAGFDFPGHTEFLCHEFNVANFAMMLFHSRLRVVLSTIHIPLKEVINNLSKEVIVERLKLTSQTLLQNFTISKPRVAVCGVNPHAGEKGLFGDEEEKIIIPAINEFKDLSEFSHVKVNGPYPADTVFHSALKGDFDAVLCQYHDQGLIPIKTTGFEEGVNLTMGLPFVRTSPDHGVAFDIAGEGIADPRSMIAAIHAAKKFKGRENDGN